MLRRNILTLAVLVWLGFMAAACRHSETPVVQSTNTNVTIELTPIEYAPSKHTN